MQNQTGGVYPQNQNNISSSAVSSQTNPNLEYKDIFYQLEQAIGADFQKLKVLVQNGVITQQQGHNLMAQLAQKAHQINTYKNSLSSSNQPIQNFQMFQQSFQQVPNSVDLFNQEHPGFFDGEGRADVLNYIKGLDMDKDEIVRISQLVERLENSAVDKYLKKSAYEKSLNDENDAAKSKLTSYAQNASYDGNNNRIFTREDIGNMSGEEFTKNEKMIMEQLRQGLIK